MAGTAVAPPFRRTAENKLQTQIPGFILGTFTVLGPYHYHEVKQFTQLESLQPEGGGCYSPERAWVSLSFIFFFNPSPLHKHDFLKSREDISECLMLPLLSFVF